MNLPMHAGHPLVVHLPLVAFFGAVGFDLVDAWSPAPRFRRAATVVWWAAFAGAAAAITTGLVAYNQVEHSDAAHQIMAVHRNVALATVALLLASALWRWRQPGSRPASLLALVGLAGLGWVGDLGASLVFHHALGIPSARLTGILEAREGDEHGMGLHAHSTMPPTAPAVADSSTPDTAHTHKHGDSHRE